MPLLQVQPTFVPTDGKFFFGCSELNSFQRAKYQDDYGFWQNMFHMFSYMKLDHDLKYTVHSPKGAPFMWNLYNACSYTESGNISYQQRSVSPCKLYMKLKWCHDTMLDSCYKTMIKWDESGDIGLDSNGQAFFQLLVDEISAMGALGLRLLLTLGQLYDSTAAGFTGFESTVTNEIQALFATATTGCRGWVKLLQDLAPQYPWLNVPGLLEATEETDFVVPILTVFDALKANAPKPLLALIDRGGFMDTGSGNPFKPLFVVSDSYYSAVVKGFNAQSVQLLQNQRRIERLDARPTNSLTPTFVYYIDGVPVVPLADLSGYDQYVSGTLHFAGIIASGNIQLGSNFAPIYDIENQDVGMIIQRSTNIANNDYGTYHILSHALVQVALADPNYAVASIVQAVTAIPAMAVPQP